MYHNSLHSISRMTDRTKNRHQKDNLLSTIHRREFFNWTKLDSCYNVGVFNIVLYL